MSTTSKPDSFNRYTEEKYLRFKKWLDTSHGQTIYRMFCNFAESYRSSGHERCGANLIGNRIRWEMGVGDYTGFKICNDFLPMLARQLVSEQPAFRDFFNFHEKPR
jgi:hypothetical protein